MSSFTVSTELRPDRQMAVDIVVAQEVVERELRKAAKKVAGKYRIPGFRQGKAPYHIIVQQFGLANLYGEFVDDMGQQVFMEAIEQTGITPYAQATLADIKLEPLTYRLLVPLAPEVKLGDYRSLRMEQPASEVDDALVDARIEQLREEYASWAPTDRPSEYGDTMTIDVRSVIPASAEGEAEIVVLNETDWDVTPDQENPMEPPGFDEELIGLAAGDTKEFQLGWPADSQSVYAGKTATFTVTVKQIEAYDKPALDDDFAALVGPDFATLDELKESIRATIAADQATSTRNAFLTSILDAIVAMSELNYPPVVVEDQIDVMAQEMDQQLRRYGLDGLETYLKRSNQTLDDYRAELAPQAETVARRNLVLSELVLAEQLTITPEELAERATRIAHQDYDPTDVEDDDAEAEAQHEEQVARLVTFFTAGEGRNMLINQMMTEKALDRIMAIARGEEVPALAAVTDDESAGADAAGDAAADEHAAPAPDAAA